MGHTFFGVQLAVKAAEKDRFRQRLHRLIATSHAEPSARDKQRFWQQAASILVQATTAFELGYWDLVRDDDDGDGDDEEDESGDDERPAQAEFDTWTGEIEEALDTDEAAAAAAGGKTKRPSPNGGYVLVTCVALVAGGSRADETLGRRCDIAEPNWWRRRTFVQLINSLPLLDFTQTRSDAIYVSPGDDHRGLSLDELRSDDYEYLRPLG